MSPTAPKASNGSPWDPRVSVCTIEGLVRTGNDMIKSGLLKKDKPFEPGDFYDDTVFKRIVEKHPQFFSDLPPLPKTVGGVQGTIGLDATLEQDRRLRLSAFLRHRRRAGAGDRLCRSRHPRRRVRHPGRPERLRQDHAAQGDRRLHPPDRRHHPVRRQAGARPGPRPRRGVPGARDPAVAHGAAEHRPWPRDRRHAARRARSSG